MPEELLYSIREVFNSYLTKQGKSFYNIPEYQRGYKWNADNVIALLDDLLAFQKSNPSANSFYCLQNITIVPEGEHFNVVDGQQRLTTMYILLSYFKKIGLLNEVTLNPDCLKYSVRTDTAILLQHKVANGKIWDDEITPDNAKSKDAWYILDVAKAISTWFEVHKQDHLDVNIVLDHLKLIVNKMEEGNETSIFAGLNGGKVDLDGADLVRAELITRAAREKYKNIDPQKVGEFRAHIGLELDDLGRWWGEPNHETFFSQLLPEIKTGKEFKDTYPINLLYRLYYAAYKIDGETFGFKFFEHGRDLNGKPDDGHWELYDSLMKMHAILKEWYDDPEIYHWLGYLFFNFKSYKQVDFANIWNIWQIDSEDRLAFIEHLKDLVRTLVVRADSDESYDNAAARLVSGILDLKHDWYHDEFLDEILILSEILWLEKNQYQNRLSPKYLRQHKEQREHIRSCQPNTNEGSEVTDAETWRNFILKVYDESDSLGAELVKIIDEHNSNTLSAEQILALNNKMNEYAQNSIGNLVLLDSHVNESYGNAKFQAKIQRIIKEFMSAERYIRPYTLNVFLKKIGDQDFEWRWTKANIEENVAIIGTNMSNFLKVDQNG